jgi:hypothetical protein
MNISNLLLVLIGFFFFFFGVAFGQVSVVQYNSSWNAENSFDISELKECKKSNVVICEAPEMKEEHKIKSVPTIIIFDEGEEVIRFEANIMMELEATRKDIQKEIDKIYLAKFE